MQVYRIPELFSMMNQIFSRLDINIEGDELPFLQKIKVLVKVLERCMSDPGTSI